MIGVLFNNLFQVVDTFYAGELSKEALAALALSFPIYFIIIGLGSGLGTGASALIGNALRAGKRNEAMRIAAQGITLTVGLGLVTGPHRHRGLAAALRDLGRGWRWRAIQYELHHSDL